jgi:hypothetical protein
MTGGHERPDNPQIAERAGNLQSRAQPPVTPETTGKREGQQIWDSHFSAGHSGRKVKPCSLESHAWRTRATPAVPARDPEPGEA